MTANASQISDGAAALVIASEEKAAELGCSPWRRRRPAPPGDPKEIFDAPAKGIKALLDSQGLGVDDIDLFEVNEAFAAQVLASISELGISEDKVNICGGGMALGHPIGASEHVFSPPSSTRCSGRMPSGVVSLCLGGGNAVSMSSSDPDTSGFHARSASTAPASSARVCSWPRPAWGRVILHPPDSPGRSSGSWCCGRSWSERP